MAKVKEKEDGPMLAFERLDKKFHKVRFNKLYKKYLEGWTDWDDKKTMKDFGGGLKARIIRNALNEDWVDVANLAMMAWNFKKQKEEG